MPARARQSSVSSPPCRSRHRSARLGELDLGSASAVAPGFRSHLPAEAGEAATGHKRLVALHLPALAVAEGDWNRLDPTHAIERQREEEDGVPPCPSTGIVKEAIARVVEDRTTPVDLAALEVAGRGSQNGVGPRIDQGMAHGNLVEVRLLG